MASGGECAYSYRGIDPAAIPKEIERDTMNSWPCTRFSALACLLVSGLLFIRSAAAQTTYGALSNFDVFNQTGQECHGFEIELDGVSSADISFTFGTPYERYGDPKLVDFAGGVYVRYESPYDPASQTFTQATPQAPSVITPTDGHACWTGGSGNYLTSGCEHFGVGVNGNPTSTTYRWLIADPNTPGALQPSGTKVSIPAPVWSVGPPPAGGGGPVVRAVIPAAPPEVNQQFGDALWVKVFVTEAPDPAELHHLVTDDPAVPQEQSETETEWVILQADPNGAGNSELASEGQVGAGKESVTRRYEFYEYTGAYDPENHEAICGGDGTCSAPLEGELGNYVGAQMAALNLAPVGPTPTETPTPTPTPTPSATPTLPPVCVGDCNGNGEVTVDDLLSMVNVALGNAAVSTCAAGDVNHDTEITVDEILAAVNNALRGCGG
jgi:hypothetical protein